MQELYAGGQGNVVATYFQGTALAGPFYVGLGTGAIPTGRTKTLADITEVTGSGYARKSVPRADSTTAGWTRVDNVVSSHTLTWTNSGGDPLVKWTDIDYMFLCLSPSGVSAPNILLGTVEVATVSLGGGQAKSFIFSFSLYNTAP